LLAQQTIDIRYPKFFDF